MDYLEYSKLILFKVSFNPDLFKRELNKSLNELDDQGKSLLKCWCVNEFGREYPEILIDSFQGDLARQANHHK